MKTLVGYASRHGATEDTARTIAARLELKGLNVDVANLTDIEGLDGYAAAILGSAVYMGKWEKSARDFLTTEQAALRQKTVWLFATGPVGEPLVPEHESLDMEEFAGLVGARGHRTFPGKLDRHELSLIERLTVAVVHAQDGDYRDWEAVDTWTDEIAEELLASAQTTTGASQ